MSYNLLDQEHFDNLNLIDWNLIALEVAKSAYFEETNERLLSPPRRKSIPEILTHYRLLGEFFKILEDDEIYELYEELNQLPHRNNLNELLLRLEKDHFLDIPKLNIIISLLEIYLYHQIFLEKLTKNSIVDQSHKDRIKNNITRPFRRFVSRSAEIDYKQHPELGPLFRNREEIDQNATITLKKLIGDYKARGLLQIDTYDIINETYVLLIRSDRYTHELGSIRGRSDSGNTLYIEPVELKRLSAERQSLSLQIEAVLYKTCMEYGQKLKAFYPVLKSVLDNLVEVDHLFCLAKYSKDKHLVLPTITTKSDFKLHGFFHPLLENPIANDLELTNNRGLIISGPNTGGKTVSLKSLCLTHLFIHYGLFVPAKEATISPSSEIYYFSQDHQNISEGLSSFAAESLQYIELINSIGPNAYLFIDEIFSSTSSEEASALAIGLFNHLNQKCAPKIFVSTHHQMLKVKTHQSKDFLSAHVGFNANNNSPTYKLHFGTPGSSQAVDIFEKLSKEYTGGTPIVDEAKKILEQKFVEYEKLLQEVATKNANLDQLLEENQNLNFQLKNQLQSQEGILKLKRDEAYIELRAEIDTIRQKAINLLKTAESDKDLSVKQFENRLGKVKASVPEVLHSQAAVNYVPLREIPKINESYYYVPLNKKGVVTQIDENKQMVTITIGNFKTSAKFTDLSKLPSTAPRDTFQFNLSKERTPQLSLDARGMRLEEFQTEVEFAISDLYAGELPYLEIIHGHGTGVLKNWLRDFLKSKKDLVIEIPKESQDGVTRIKLS